MFNTLFCKKLKGLHLDVTKIRCVLLSVADPDLQMSGGGRGCVPKNFRPFGPQFGIKLSWGGEASLDRPLAVLGKFGAEVIA